MMDIAVIMITDSNKRQKQRMQNIYLDWNKKKK